MGVFSSFSIIDKCLLVLYTLMAFIIGLFIYNLLAGVNVSDVDLNFLGIILAFLSL